MKPKKLSLQEIYKIYLLLEPKRSTLDEIIEDASPEALLECVGILYDNKARFDSPIGFLDLLISGLMKNDFYDFLVFIEDLKNGSAK